MIPERIECPECRAPFVPEGDGMLRDSFVQSCKCSISFKPITVSVRLSGSPRSCLHCEGWGCSRCDEAPPPPPPRSFFEVKSRARLMPGPRAGGSPVYGLRLEALIECEAIASENFREEWADRCWITPSDRAEFRKRARRALAGIRAMRMAIGSTGPVLIRAL